MRVYFITVAARVSAPLVESVETSEGGELFKEIEYKVLKEENDTYFPPFCIFIINHLLCWPELWKRSSVRYFFKRSFLCFLNVCAPFFVFVRKKEGIKSNPDSLARRERLVRVTAGGRVKRMLFLPQNRHKCFHL